MERPLDPMSVERAATPSESYVLRRRYGPVRYVIAAVSWMTVFNLLFQPVAALAATYTWDNSAGNNDWSTGANWSGTPDNTEPTISDGSGYKNGAGVSGATTTPGSGRTPGNTSSPYYISGTGYNGASGNYFGGNGQVTLVAPAISGAVVTLTGGTINFGDTGSGAAGVTPEFVRVAVGLENIEDIKADFAQAFS